MPGDAEAQFGQEGLGEIGIARVQHGLRKMSRYYDQGRHFLRRADGVVQRAIGLYANNSNLVPAQYRGKVEKGISSYNALREKAGHADTVVQHLRAG